MNPEIVKDFFSYANGNLYWIGKTTPKRKFGQKVGTKGSHGYLMTYFDGKLHLVHRLIYAMFNGHFPAKGLTIDHIDGDKQNNKIENLRIATYSENLANKKFSKSFSGVKNVTWNPENEKWRVRINFNKKKIEVGSYKNFDDAVRAAKDARQKLHKEFACHD